MAQSTNNIALPSELVHRSSSKYLKMNDLHRALVRISSELWS